MPKCRYCEEKYEKTLSTQPGRVCLKPDCVVAYWSEHTEKCREKAKKEQRRETRRMREKAKTTRDFIKEADPEYSRFIRLRDIDEPCISCGRYDHEIKEVFRGGKWDCGHYLAKGSHTDLRFHPDNAHKQCKVCNGGAGQYTKKNYVVQKAYRENLIIKIGIKRVEWLEGPHEIQNWTHEDLREIKLYYRDKWKQLEKG